MPSFNLVDQPWIPCRLTNGGLVEFALRDTLRRAAEIEAITGESPMVTITIHRLLLAILHRCFGPADTSAWGGLWRVGRFDPTMVDRYLDRWRERFDLFDPERPFFQVSTLDGTKGVYPLWRALQVMAEPLLFDHASEFKPRAVTPAEAARLLIAFQSFDYGGIKSAETSRHFAKASPLVQRAVALVRGPTLFHTLLLNLHKYNADDETPFPFDAAEDAPAWEHEHQTEPRERSVRGPLDLLTWQSRRLRLLPETAVDGSTCVRSVVVMMGWQFPNSFDVGQGYETMVAFRPNLQAKTTGNAWIPIGFREDRALWRDSTSIVGSAGGRAARPMTLSWLGDLVAEGELDRAGVLPVAFLGFALDRANALFWRHEELPLPAAYLTEDGGALRDALGRAIALAEGVGRLLGTAPVDTVTAGGRTLTVASPVRQLAGLLLAPQSDNREARQPHADDVRKLVDHLAPQRRYWPRLDSAFARLVVDLPDDGNPHDGYGDRALAGWATAVRRAAETAFGEACAGLARSARTLKAVAVAERSFRRLLHERVAPFEQAASTAAITGGDA